MARYDSGARSGRPSRGRAPRYDDGYGGGPRFTGMESNRWRGAYGSDYRPDRGYRDSPHGGYRGAGRSPDGMRGYDRDPRHGYGPRGLYGGSMYGGGRYGREYLGAWGPGGWSSEHGRAHSGLRDADRYGYDYRRFADEAPTG